MRTATCHPGLPPVTRYDASHFCTFAPRTARGAVPTSYLPFPAFPPPYLYLLTMTSRRLILAYFVLVLIAMTWVSWYACVTRWSATLHRCA